VQFILALFTILYSLLKGKTVKGVNLRRDFQKRDIAFLKQNALRRYFLAILKLTGVKGQNKSNLILSLIPLIQTNWKNSGVVWITKYWGEVFRYIIAYLNGQVLVDAKFWVKRTRGGLPVCIPLPMRNLIIKFKNSKGEDQSLIDLIRSILSCLNFYRACSGYHKVSLDTVIRLHSGTIKSFDQKTIKLVLKKMQIRKILNLEVPKYFIPQKAGVNANHTFVSVGWDFIALALNPTIFLAHLKWCVHYKYYFHFYYMIILLITLSPIIFVLSLGFILNKKDILFLGRLAIIEEARQKARVVGITDWWTQVLFKPLHDRIASILKTLPEDGTFDQIGPVKKMLSLHKSDEPIVSSDLSAATDRLPVLLQADILTAMGVPGDLWMQILDRPYFTQRPKPGVVKYSVGQPMGVYSSFVMLSLTNHILNVLACENSLMDYTPGSNIYSVLGDDVSSRDAEQAKSYVMLLNLLGVTVNPIKGFNGKVCEFAKRIFFNAGKGNFIEISPVGAKVVLQAMTNPMYAVAFLSDMSNKQYSLEYAVSLLSNYLTTLFKRGRTPEQMIACQAIHLFTLLGPQSGLYDLNKHEDGSNPFYLNFKSFLAGFGLSEEKYLEVLSNKALNLWAKPNDILAVSKTLFLDLFKVSVLTKVRENDFIFLSDSCELQTEIVSNYRVPGLVQVLVTTLLATITAFPILIKGLVEKYFNFLILEFSTRDTLTQAGGQQLNIIKSVTKRLTPKSFQDLAILDKIDMTMFGRIPFLVSFIPFNVLLDKIKVVGIIDQMPAIKVAIAFLKDHNRPLYDAYIKYLKELKNERKNSKKAKSENRENKRKNNPSPKRKFAARGRSYSKSKA